MANQPAELRAQPKALVVKTICEAETTPVMYPPGRARSSKQASSDVNAISRYNSSKNTSILLQGANARYIICGHWLEMLPQLCQENGDVASRGHSQLTSRHAVHRRVGTQSMRSNIFAVYLGKNHKLPSEMHRYTPEVSREVYPGAMVDIDGETNNLPHTSASFRLSLRTSITSRCKKPNRLPAGLKPTHISHKA